MVNLVIDTETNGLLNNYHKPFMVIIGTFYSNNPLEIKTKIYLKDEFHLIQPLINKAESLIFHNAKFDAHMLKNIGISIFNKNIPIHDTMVMLRLSSPAISLKEGGVSIGLKKAAKAFFGEDSIQEQKELNSLRAQVRKKRSQELDHDLKLFQSSLPILNKKLKSDKQLTVGEVALLKKHKNKYPTIKGQKEGDNISYEQLWEINPSVINKYAINDVKLTHKLYLVLTQNYKIHIIQKEAYDLDIKTIEVLFYNERKPLQLNTKYIDSKKLEIESLIKKHESEFVSMLKSKEYGIETSRSTPTMKKYLKELYPKINFSKLDQAAVDIYVKGDYPKHLKEILSKAVIIKKITKKYSTDLMSIYNQKINNKYYANFNIASTVTGRLSSNIQQLPKKGYSEEGVELFNPRMMFKAPKDYYWVFIDYSQMELKLMAIYSHLINEPDVNLLRMFVPYKIEERNWNPTDMHSLTAQSVFKDWEAKRSIAKSANFAILYGAGIRKIQAMTNNIDGQKLYKAFHKNFQSIEKLNLWLKKQWFNNEYTFKNLYGRIYYIPPEKKRFLRNALNYIIQGTGASALKTMLVKSHKLLLGKKSHIILNIHDEIQFYVHKDELNLIPQLRKLMTIKDWIVPLTVDIEYTTTTWDKLKKY